MLIERPKTTERLLELAGEMGQHTDPATGNVGYGYIYYGLVRLVRPETVVCVGSYRGFAPVCLALALAHNRHGLCTFIDPGRVDDHWHDPGNLEALDRDFGLEGRLRHLRKTSQQVISEGEIAEEIDLLVIDGDHSYQGVKFDFDRLGAKVVPGSIRRDVATQTIDFEVTDGTTQIPVSYRGLAPDTFTDDVDIEVVVEGRLGTDGVFQATTLLAKCGSRYEAQYDTEAQA